MDVSVIRLVVVAIFVLTLVALLGVCIVAAEGREPPLSLVTIASSGTTGLFALLVTPRPPQPVKKEESHGI